ncbi:MAG: hypothetical protein HYV09_36615 [Deltaproteobacteria bacterium]|nr:hypothetical protein [Deltaproteobacteria bacterium]
MFTLATYLVLRASELEALGWYDLDLEHGVAHVHRSVVRTHRTQDGETKSQRSRRLAIGPTLIPLIRGDARRSRSPSHRWVLSPMPPGTILRRACACTRSPRGSAARSCTRWLTRRWITFHELRPERPAGPGVGCGHFAAGYRIPPGPGWPDVRERGGTATRAAPPRLSRAGAHSLPLPARLRQPP